MDSRIRIVIHGAVQGVGFRPFVYRLAGEMKLNGWVVNSSNGVFIEAEGNKSALDKFLLRVQNEKPPRSYIQSLEFSYLDPLGFKKFEIRKSDTTGNKTALLLPDIAACDECLNDIFDPGNRRYLYPFTNCTNCGPRFSIIVGLPYDRANTSMRVFEMCDKCKNEYGDPLNRRFHAQPNACPVCGPHLELWDRTGKVIEKNHNALLETAEVVRNGKIAAVKGIGGFHLIVDARNKEAVQMLRKRKHREEKPLALMFPDLDTVMRACEVSEFEKRLLVSPESPIVLLRKKQGAESEAASSIAPGNPYLGILLPYTPLHHILMKELGFPVVATSGNLSDEPICTDEREALIRLNNIADVFLVHNRPIVRHVDDSIVRVISGREMVVRRARGYAPLPVMLKNNSKKILAVGAHLKNTISVNNGDNVFISQHIGDLETAEAYNAFRRVIKDLPGMYEITPEVVSCDMHPDYISTGYAHNSKLPVISVQHHYAHIASCMAENDIEGPALGVSWDGTGYGTDRTVWGGEFLLVNDTSYKRIAHLRTFRLPGGEKAIKEIYRSAIGLLFEIYGEKLFVHNDLKLVKGLKENERNIFAKMLKKSINSPITSSAGRLFDAVAYIAGVSSYSHFEGQAAMQLEFAADSVDSNETYNFRILENETKNSDVKYIADWEPMILDIIKDVKNDANRGLVSVKFHNTLSNIILELAKLIEEKKIVLSGGCFQNKYLAERTINLLLSNGFKPYWHQRVPPNDGGISLGQIAAASKIIDQGVIK